MVLFRFRNGFGVDIEHNADIHYVGVNEETEDEYLLAFEGMIIRLPLLQILIGELGEVGKLP